MVHQHIVQTERCKTFADISYETESSQNKLSFLGYPTRHISIPKISSFRLSKVQRCVRNIPADMIARVIQQREA